MNTYTVTISFSDQTIIRDYKEFYSIDAVNMAIDDALNTSDLINEKGSFKVVCVLKTKGE